VLAILLAIPLLPLLLWWLVQRFDEAPSADARRYAELAPRDVADADNAWMHFAGMGAAEDDDPLRLARERVDTLQARHARVPAAPADAAEQALFDDPVPMLRPDAALDGSAGLCRSERVNCIDWAGHYHGMLARLQVGNRLRLARYERVLALLGWQGMYPPTLDAPLPETTIADLQRNLIALDLGAALATDDSDRLTALVGQLADASDFWRHVATQGGDLVSVVSAATRVHRAQLLIGDLLDRVPLPIDPALDTAIGRVLAALPTDIDWQRALAYEYQVFAHTLGQELPGTLGGMRRCFAGTASGSCLQQLAMDAAVVPQATFNLHASNTAALQRWLEAPPHEIDAAGAAYSAAFEAMAPNFDDTGTILRQMAYNYAGRVLVAIAVPKADYALRLHDFEAVRRMLVLKKEALTQGVTESAFDAFVAAQPAALRNPYSGSAFEWDALVHELHFAARAGEATTRVSRIGVRPRATAGVTRCAQPLQIEMLDRLAPEGTPVLAYLACGDGSGPVWADAGGSKETDDARMQFDQRVIGFDVWRNAERIGLRLRWNEGGEITRHEADLVLEEGAARAEFRAVDGDSSQFSVEVRDGSPIPVLAINAVRTPERELAGQIARAGGARLRGVERLSTDLTTLRGSLRLDAALGLLADGNGRRLRQVSATEYVIE